MKNHIKNENKIQDKKTLRDIYIQTVQKYDYKNITREYLAILIK